MCCTFQGRRMPLKKSGIHIGRTTASLSSFLASSRSAMSSLTAQPEKSVSKEGRQKPTKLVRVQPTSAHLGSARRYPSPEGPPGHCHILHHQTSSALYLLDLLPPFFPDGLKKKNKKNTQSISDTTSSIQTAVVQPSHLWPSLLGHL